MTYLPFIVVSIALVVGLVMTFTNAVRDNRKRRAERLNRRQS